MLTTREEIIPECYSFNPVTLEITWQYTPLEAGNLLFTDASKFYSSYISSAQRLPNGNTLITEDLTDA